MQVGLGQHQAHTTVLKHMRQAFAGVLRVQRHIGRSCLEHREQADHHGKGALHGDPHQPLGADALSQQVMRQAVGLTVQFSIAEGLLIQGQGLTFRLLISLGFKQPVYSLKGGDTSRGVPVLEHPVLLSGTHHRQLAEAAAGCTHHRLQQVLPMLRQALDGGGIEQVGGVGQRGPKPVGGFMGVQAQVKMGGLAVPVQFHHTQARQLLAFAAALGLGLVVEHHLEQRVMAQAAFRLQCHHQLLERQVLMSLGLEGAAFGLLQQLGKAHLPVKVSLEYLGVDEEADQPLGFDTVTVGVRHANADIRLPAVAIQQGLERRQQ